MLRRRDRKRRNQRIAAGVVGLAVFVAATALVTTGWPFDRAGSAPGGGGETGPTGPTGPPDPTVAPVAGDIVGLPSPGATASTPEHGRVVLSLGGGVGTPWTAVWVYTDGRVIWGDVTGYFPPGAPTEGATGFVEQHLTPAGVEFLRTQVLSTGLFEHDLELFLDRTGMLTIEVRNGDRLVRLTWAVQRSLVGDAPPATPEQANALQGIHALLSDPTSWPASAWEDEDPATFVPSRYQVWLRVFADQYSGSDVEPNVGDREFGLLPTRAADILRGGTPVRDATYELTTDEIRALAEALNEAGLEPWGPSGMGEAVLRYSLDNPYQPGTSLWVFVGPVLPHGEAIFLGPG
jgi:hypothetical protein